MRWLIPLLSVAFFSTVAATAQVHNTGTQAGASPQVRGQPLLRSDFSGVAPGANTPWLQTSLLDSHLAFSGWQLGNGATGSLAVDDALAFAINAGATEATLSEAMASASFASFTLQPAGSQAMELNGVRLRLGIRRLEWHSSRRYALYSSVAGFTPGAELLVSPYLESWDQSEHVWDSFIPTSGYEDLQAPVEFRLYCYGGTFSNKPTSITRFGMVASLPTVTFNLASSPGGSASVSPQSQLYQQGQSVQLTANPATGFRFAGWSGDLSGFGNPRTVVLESSMQAQAQFEPVPLPDMSVGMNLIGVTDWTSSWVFTDLFRRTRSWMTSASDGSGPWASGFTAELPLDPNGFPHSIPFTPLAGGVPQIAHTILVGANGAGPHRILFEGVGTFRFTTSTSPWTQVVGNGPASEALFNMPANGDLSLSILNSAAAPNNLRNIRVVADAHLGTYLSEPFHPLFMATLADFDHLRFMDWGATNGSYVQDWSDRTLPNEFTQSAPAGVALEVQIDLANRLQKDAWFCVPHKATDDYVRQMARLVRDTLDPALLAYVEYSNETWNTMASFTQTAYVQKMGQVQGLSSTPWDAGQFFVAKRSAEIWQIFDEEYGSEARTRTRRVLATHAAATSTTQLRISALNDLAMNPNNQHADAIAIAPYFGSNFAPVDIPPTPGTTYPLVNDLLNVDAPARITEAINMCVDHKAIANLQGMELICYEGGQHYVTIYGAENDPVMVQILQDVNRDPRMHMLYMNYLDGLKAAGVEAFANFSHCDTWTKWGSWGALESIDQPLSAAPKFQALLDWIAAN